MAIVVKQRRTFNPRKFLNKYWKILVIAVLVVGVAGVGFWVVNNRTNFIKPKRETPDQQVSAIHTLLSSDVSYEGTWFNHDQTGIEVLFPGEYEEPKEDSGIFSQAFAVNYLEEDSSVIHDAYGFLYLNDSIDYGVTDYPEDLAELITDHVFSDIAKINKMGLPSGAYEIDAFSKGGTDVLSITGNVIMQAAYRSPEDKDDIRIEAVEMPIVIYTFIKDNHPITLWCFADNVDVLAKGEAEDKINEMLNTIWTASVFSNKKENELVDINYSEP